MYDLEMQNLKRYPVRKNDLLQAWDAADELILAHLRECDLKNKKILILNDHFGALSATLKDCDITVYTDSYISHMSICLNSQDKIRPISNLKEISGNFDYVLLRLPKNLSFLEDILCHVSQHLNKDAQIIAGFMIKHQSSSWFDLLNKYMGETRTSLAQKKARLIFASFTREALTSPYPKQVTLDGFIHPFTQTSNLFSREKLDIGTRFFLEHIPTGNYNKILDLGCANGVIGIKAKKINPSAHIIFSDESAMALESARINYKNFTADDAGFHWTNCYENGEENSLDLVLCNPPFHQGQVMGDFIAKQMFEDAKRCLKVGGLLRVIGNTHLAYQVKLKQIFGDSKIIATNSKFIIVDAVK